jgi:hypothetical protein
MRSAIFVWASLLLIGSVSISQSYPNHHEDNDENQLNELKARLASVLESSESSESKRDEWFNAALKKRSSSCTPCKPDCGADELCTSSGVCTCPGGAGNTPCPIQSHDLCSSPQTAGVKPVVSITFGAGSSKYSSATPASLGFSTAYPQVSNTAVNDGYFTIVNSVPQDFSSWLGGGLDHTTSCNAGSSKGYMMVVNAMYAPNKDFFIVKADNLCVGLRYEFSFYAANINKKGTNILLPNFLVTVTSATGSNAVLASLVTGPLPEQPTLTWVKVGMSFIATSSSVVASLNSITPGGTGNDFALDDITFVSCAPKSDGVCH